MSLTSNEQLETVQLKFGSLQGNDSIILIIHIQVFLYQIKIEVYQLPAIVS